MSEEAAALLSRVKNKSEFLNRVVIQELSDNGFPEEVRKKIAEVRKAHETVLEYEQRAKEFEDEAYKADALYIKLKGELDKMTAEIKKPMPSTVSSATAETLR
jgi:hypothetical protein